LRHLAIPQELETIRRLETGENQQLKEISNYDTPLISYAMQV
jgi:hypothetical protein